MHIEDYLETAYGPLVEEARELEAQIWHVERSIGRARIARTNLVTLYAERERLRARLSDVRSSLGDLRY